MISQSSLTPDVRFDARANRFAERLDVFARRLPIVDQEIAVHIGNLRATDAQAPAPRLVDELPGTVAGRIAKRRAAGALLDRLVLFPVVGDVVHLFENFRRISGRSFERRLREDPAVGNAAMAISESHVSGG